MALFDGDRLAHKKIAITLADRLQEQRRDGEAQRREEKRVYRKSPEFYILSHCRLITSLAVLLLVSSLLVMWLMVCMRAETREHDAALRKVEKYTAEDLLDDNIRLGVKNALDVINGDILFNALCRMVTDLPLMRILGDYEQGFRQAWQDAMRQHVFVGFLCVLVALTVISSFMALFYFTCNRRAWRPATDNTHRD